METTGIDWAVLGQQVLAVVLGVIGTAFSLLVTLWVKRMAAKKGIEIDEADLEKVSTVVRQAVYATERWAQKAESKPIGSAKLEYCMKTVRTLLSNQTVKTWTDEQLTHLIESFMQQEYKYVNEKPQEEKA